MKYDFDEIIDRCDTNALKTDGFRRYLLRGDESLTLPYKDEDLIQMWVADMDFAAPQVVIDAVKERLDHRIFGYTKLFNSSYYNAFVGWAGKRYGWQFNEKDLFTSPGVIPALYELVGHICAPDEKVLFLTPTYAFFKHAADYNGVEPIHSDLIVKNGRYKIDFDDLAKKTSDPKVTLFILCNPHNPTGRIWAANELERLGRLLTDRGIWIISDEIHCDILRVGRKHLPFAKIFTDYPRLITCMAPSKTFNLAGMMFANVIMHDQELKEKWVKRHYDIENPLALAAVEAAYAHGEDWLEHLKIYLDQNLAFIKQYLAKNLPKARFEIPEATYLAWVDINDYLPSGEEIFLPSFFAEKAGVLLEGGSMFVANADGFIRLNAACPLSKLKIGLERICQTLTENI